MANSAIMSVRITGNSDDAVKAFQQAATKASAFGSALGGIAVKGVTALWDTIKNFSASVIDMSDSTDKFMQTMSFAGLDTSAIETATERARKYADETVYDLSTIQNTTAQLAANGIKDYSGLTEAAGNLNAVAGGNADTFQSVAMVLTQTAGAGKLTTDNWNQLADAIPGASGKLQEAMLKNGAYTGNFRDAMEQGQITADEFNQAIMDLGMSDVAQEAATSTATIEGAMGNLEAAITGGLTDALNLVKPLITDSIGGAAELIGNLLSDATNALGDFIDGLSRTDAVSAASTMFDAIGRALQSVGGALGDLAETLVPALDGLSDAGGIGQTVGDAFSTAAGFVTTVADKLTAFGEWVSANSEPIATALAGIAGGLAAFKVASLIGTAVSALQGFSVAATAASVAQAALNLVMSMNPLMLVVTAIGAVVAALVYFFTQTETGKQIWQDFTNFISGAVENIKAWFQDMGEKIKQFFQDAGDFVTEKWEAVTSFFQELPDKISGFFSGIGDKIGKFFQDAADSVTEKWEDVKQWFANLPDKISGFFSNAGSLLWNAGSAIINGLWDGLKSAWSNVTSWVSGLGDWIADHKGPASYDRVLLVGNGRLIMQGLAKGMNDGLASYVAPAVATANGLLSGIGAARTLGATPATATVINHYWTVQLSDLNPDPDKTARAIKRLVDAADKRRS